MVELQAWRGMRVFVLSERRPSSSFARVLTAAQPPSEPSAQISKSFYQACRQDGAEKET